MDEFSRAEDLMEAMFVGPGLTVPCAIGVFIRLKESSANLVCLRTRNPSISASFSKANETMFEFSLRSLQQRKVDFTSYSRRPRTCCKNKKWSLREEMKGKPREHLASRHWQVKVNRVSF